jgi:hypothetical protein
MEWDGPFDLPGAALCATAVKHNLESKLKESVFQSLMTWMDYEPDLLGSLLEVIASDTNIVCQKRDDGWYAILDQL